MVAALAIVIVPLALAGPASARFTPITGKLSKSGYTVIAVSYDGKAAVAKGPAFRMAAPGRRVTLQLRDSHGKYAGPVVVAGRDSKVFVGVKAGAKLGEVKVLRGYARVTNPLKSRWLDRSRWAHARNGVPLGNGLNYGLVRISDTSGSRGAGGDIAHSGVPNDISIDADADAIIDALRPAGRLGAHAAQAAPPGGGGFQIFSQLLPQFEDSVNADASAISTAQIDATMARWATLFMQVVQGDVTNLDCGGLTYCSPGGTGHLYVFPGSGITPTCSPNTPGCNYNEGPAFPACCDGDRDGLGDLPQNAAASPARAFPLLPEANSARIGSGDVLIQRVTKAGVVTQTPSSISFVFVTEPALMRWSSGSDSATVSYPVASGSPGTQRNPWPIGGGTGDVVVTFTFWRPQRKGIAGAGEPAFMDIGHLAYFSRPYVLEASPGTGVGGSQPFSCPASSYSTSDPNLVVTTSGPESHVVDRANDAPANPANTLTYSLDLTTCLAAHSVTLASGNVVQVDISARSATSGDNTGQNFTFRLR